jgi:3-oxoacyl-[acyl-carrier-protein] synthase II
MDWVISGIGQVGPTGAAEANWFDVAARLPGRGYRRLPAACQYLIAATGDAIRDAGDVLSAVDSDQRAAVVGTNNAVTGLLAEMDRTIIDHGADELSPAQAPFFAVSVLTARLASEFGLHGGTLTTHSPRTAGLDAVQLGARALAAGRAKLVIVGATEPGTSAVDRTGTGAVSLVCEPAELAEARGARAYGTVAVATAFLDAATPDTDVLDLRWPSPADPVDAVLGDSPVCHAVRKWAERSGREVVVTPAGEGCLTPMRRIAEWYATGAADRRHVVTAADQGAVSMATVTIFGSNHAATKED